MPLHEAFGKVLTALQLCTCCTWAHHHDVAQPLIGLEVVDDACHQGVLAANYHHVNLVVDGCLPHSVKVHRLNGQQRSILCHAGIARGDK